MPKKNPQTPKTAKFHPPRRKNSELRTREYLTDKEIERLRKAAREYQHYGLRNDTIGRCHLNNFSKFPATMCPATNVDDRLFFAHRVVSAIAFALPRNLRSNPAGKRR